MSGILQKFSNREIGTKLKLSERTVKFHVSKLLLKFDVSGRGGLRMKAAGLVSNVKVPAVVDAVQLAQARVKKQLEAPERSQ